MQPPSILPSTWNVPQRFRDRLGAGVGRQRAMFFEGHLLLVLHAPPESEEEGRRARFFWRQPDGTWSSSEFGGGANALNRHLSQFDEAVDKFSAAEEKAHSAEDYFEVINGLAPLLRATRNLHSTLQEARKLVESDREIINFRDRAYEIERQADLLMSDAKNSLDYVVARRAEEQAGAAHQMAVSAHRLNLLAALFFPIATLCAVFGVNLETGLEHANPPFWFLIVMGCGLATGLLLAGLITRPSAEPRKRGGGR